MRRCALVKAPTRSLVAGGDVEPVAVLASFADRVRRIDPLLDPLLPTALLPARSQVLIAC